MRVCSSRMPRSRSTSGGSSISTGRTSHARTSVPKRRSLPSRRRRYFPPGDSPGSRGRSTSKCSRAASRCSVPLDRSRTHLRGRSTMCHGHRSSIHCILPPYVLRNLARNGTPQQREAANRTLALDGTIRSLRAAKTREPVSADLAPAAVASVGVVTRNIFDAHNGQALPGDAVRCEGAPAVSDPAVNEAYDALGSTFDFYWQTYRRNSIDDEGLTLNATVHFGQAYNNAFWDGQRMVFGDGDGQIFNRFTISLDVIGHELTHGVTEDEAHLLYFFQAGALNESMSDVFGSLVKQYALKQTADQADWLIGAGLFTPAIKGVALRSMKEPGTAFDDPVLGKDPQPGHMKDFVKMFEDNGGVHINSGIPN